MGGYARSNKAKLSNQYRGTCKICRRIIAANHDAHWMTGRVIGLVHDDCAERLPATDDAG